MQVYEKEETTHINHYDMKRTIFTIVLAMAIAIGASAQKTYVLLVGISSWDVPPEAGFTLNDLPPCAKDMKNLKKVFDKQKDFVTTIITGENATRENIVRKLGAIVKLATPQDKIIFAFSGHGGVEPSLDRGCFSCYHGESFLYDELCNMLSKSQTKEVFCIISACQSGLAEGAIKRIEGGGAVPAFITSSRGDEYTSIDVRMLMAGIFIKAITKGLRGKADSDGNKEITFREAYKYVYNDVQAHFKNSPEHLFHPQLIGPTSLFDTVITRW